MAVIDSNKELVELLEDWSKNLGSGVDPVPLLTRISELIEKETESYFKMDPDPFDERHPSRARPDCNLGLVLKTVFKNDDFMNKLVTSYVYDNNNLELQTAASRLLIDLLPGLETQVVFSDTQNLVNRLFERAEKAEEPLKSYSVALLSAAMEVQDIAISYKEQNMQLVPLLLRRLKQLSKEPPKTPEPSKLPDRGDVHNNAHGLNNVQIVNNVSERPFSVFQKPNRSPDAKRCSTGDYHNSTFVLSSGMTTNGNVATNNGTNATTDNETSTLGSCSNLSPVCKRRRISSPVSPGNSSCASSIGGYHRATESNSSWAEIEPLLIGSVQLYPLTSEMKQRFILQYLTPMGDYQELLYHIFEEDALGLILHYIDLNENHDVRLAFESLKYLASLLCHKKFALEFLNREGLQKLLNVYRPSVAATGVSICLYYLAYSEDAMERICVLPRHVLQELVVYCLWLLECSHDSSRCHATMFFSLSFAFRVILDLFDGQDGLRKLLNVMFLLDIFAEDDSDFTEDELIQKRQTARHVCVALKRYFEAHLIIESENLRRSPSSSSSSSLITHKPSSPSSSSSCVPPYKAARFSSETIHQHVESMLELMSLKVNWKPVDDLIKLGGFKLLINLIEVSDNWSFNGKTDAVKSALDVLVICSVVPKFQLLFNEVITNQEGHDVPAMNVILSSLEEDRLMGDAEVVKSALHVIINCVCGPVSRIGGNYARLQSSGGHGTSGSSMTPSRKKSATQVRSGEEVLTKMWKSVKDNDGIPILLNLLLITTPITEADAIRALACKALCGLSRYDEARQIIGKRPIFSNGTLQSLMKEPILQDKRSEHVKFCKSCMDLIYKVTGQSATSSSNSFADITPDSLNKAEVVAQTKIVYNEKELLELIHQHLINKGYSETAATLQSEAGLPFTSSRIMPSPWPSKTPIRGKIDVQHPVTLPRSFSLGHGEELKTLSQQVLQSSQQVLQCSQNSSQTLTPSTPPCSYLRNLRERHRSSGSKLMKSCPALQKPSVAGSGYQASPVLKKMSESSSMSKKVTLDSIVTEYLRKQHALCKNPIVTCPPFDLFKPHRCPEVSNTNSAPLNMAMRMARRQTYPPNGGNYGSKMTRKLIYSKFKPIKTFKDGDGANSFTTCAFSHVDQFLFLGTVSGEMATFNLDTGSLVATYNCHEADITHIEPSKDGKSIITCSIWRTPVSALWSFTDVFDVKMSFEEDLHVEFGKASQDKAIGTKNSIANLYDLNTGRKTMTFHDETRSNKYIKNQATFSYSDELVLNDGILWDVRSSSIVHKFDKFNKTINGLFHPNGTEIIANAEIWDMRTYHLLKTVPALDQCRLKFNTLGDVIYGTMFEEETSEDDNGRSPYGSSFRTFDASDYSNIATIDIKRTIYDLAVDPGDSFIAVVENMTTREALRYDPTESICRLYEVGRNKEDDEDLDDDEEDEDDDGDNDSDDETDDEDLADNTDDFGPGDLDIPSHDEDEDDDERNVLEDIDSDIDDMDSDDDDDPDSSDSSGDDLFAEI